MTKQKQQKNKEKAFNNHTNNGIRLTFPNGIRVSTIFGYGSYSDNHDYKPKVDNKATEIENIMAQFEKIEEGSNTVEVMIFGATEQFISRLLKEVVGDKYNPVGYINMKQWLKIINRCANYKKQK